MKKNVFTLIILLLTGFTKAQWLSVPTPFSPSNGVMQTIDVGSSNQVIGTAFHTNGSGYWIAYKFNFTSNSWDIYQDLQLSGFNIFSASIASDGTVWTRRNTNQIYKNNILKTGLYEHISARSSTHAIALTSGNYASGNNLYKSDAADAFTLETAETQGNHMNQVEIGNDGTIWGINETFNSGSNLLKFTTSGWVAQSSGSLNWQDIAVGDNNKILAVRGNQLYYLNPSTGAFTQDLTAPANVKEVSIAGDGTVYLLTTATNNNIYKNTWSAILCGVQPEPTIVGNNPTYICAGTTATLTANGSGTINWYDSPTATTPIFTGNTFTTPTITSTTNYYFENVSNSCASNRILAQVALNGSVATPVNTTPTQNLTVCPGQGTTLTAQAPSSSAFTNNWYATNTGSPALATGNTFNVPGSSLNETTTFYLQRTRISTGCTSSFVPITITVQSAPNAPVNVSTIAQMNICSGESTNLNVTGTGTINWYSDANATTLISSGTSLTTPNLTNTTTYYTRINGTPCNSIITPITVTVSGLPQVPTNSTPTSNLSVCNGSSANLTAAGSGTLIWFNAPTGGNQLAIGSNYTTNNLTTNTTFYVQSGSGNCASTRLAIPVTIKQASANTINTSSCQSYSLNNQNYTTTGTYTQTLTNVVGCDSVITLNLIITNPTQVVLNQTSCNSYTLNSQTYTTSGTYIQNLQNAAGCDSTITLNLVVNQPTSSILNQTSCSSFTLNSQTYTTSGTYTQNLQNVAGCDSTITLNLTITIPTTSTINAYNCGTGYTLNNQTYTAAGTYIQNLQNVAGCDSTITINLMIGSPNTATLIEENCGSFTLNNQTYSTSGTFTQTLQNLSGCDSVITLNLTILTPTSSIINTSECESYTLNGTTYLTSGTYVQTIPNAAGCDSVITLNLTINSVTPTITLNGGTLSTTATGGTFQWVNCDTEQDIAGANSQTFTPSVTGNYAVAFTSNGCTELSNCLNVNVVGLEDLAIETISVAPNPTKDNLTISTQSNMTISIVNLLGEQLMKVELNEGQNAIKTENLVPGVYLIETEKGQTVRFVKI